ncbi:PIN domain-containing protein [Gordonia sp. ABSL11-1]|uniref:PIN domain-containing protein n=1 Tax=Gordonia sp. ABSL11-1 TaxID=3053924 RepID=UPI0025726A2A|nr:PIN domain-containing protein [Gordonia sp. ABSL11-1]MDL9948563.1 PIN domain-containing protein [Gordonia sp. ABSL11-1]
MPIRVVLDACVLLPYQLCDTLLRLADAGLFVPLWSTEILDEVERNLTGTFDVELSKARRRVRQMQQAFPDAMVDGWQSLEPAMTNDPKDRHVLAAAVQGGADLIVTANLKDFPASALEPHDVEAIHPDDFLQDQYDLDPEATLQVLRDQRAAYTRPAMSFEEFHRALAETVPRFAETVAADQRALAADQLGMPLPLEATSDEEAMAAFFPDGDPSWFTPLGAAWLWWSALLNLDEAEEAVRALTWVPDAWDFQAVATELEDWAMMQFVDKCKDAPDEIAYVKLMPSTGHSMRSFGEGALSDVMVLTVIFDGDRWFVWGLSDNYFPSLDDVSGQ